MQICHQGKTFPSQLSTWRLVLAAAVTVGGVLQAEVGEEASKAACSFAAGF